MMPPEQVDSWLLPPEDLSLRGGLKGRLAGEFCLLESQVDALTRCLDKQASPAIPAAVPENAGGDEAEPGGAGTPGG